MQRILFLFLALISFPSLAGDFLLIDSLKEKGFVCTALGSHPADLCKVNKVSSEKFKYPLAVGIIVPNGLSRPATVLVHYHGFQNVCRGDTIKNPMGIVNDFNLYSQMEAANLRDAVMIIPMSTGKIETFKSKLIPQATAFHKWIVNVVDPENPQWIFSGHSAGGYVLNHALGADKSMKNISSVILLDATYWADDATQGRWKQIAKRNSNLKLYSVYKSGTRTEAGSRIMKKTLGNIARLSTSGSSHCSIPNKEYGRLLLGNRK